MIIEIVAEEDYMYVEDVVPVESVATENDMELVPVESVATENDMELVPV
jgi:hypothetical protein